MKLRKAVPADRPAIDAIFASARQFMKESGNPNQWKDNRPLPAAIERDIEQSNLYVLEEDRTLLGVFALIFGEDPTYQIIESGAWPNNKPYCTIHRIAAAKAGVHLFSLALDLAAAKCEELRIDTHQDNQPMRRQFEKFGIEPCGVIYTDDGTPRLAFAKSFSKEEREKAKNNPLLSGLI